MDNTPRRSDSWCVVFFCLKIPMQMNLHKSFDELEMRDDVIHGEGAVIKKAVNVILKNMT